jgi:anti-sigma-K factor RskA
VTAQDDHLHYEDDLAAYLLDALPADEARQFQLHLDGCPRCQERAGWLRTSVEMLPAAVEQLEPPPALRGRLMATVHAEAETQPTVPAQTARPARKRSWRSLPALPRPALAMAAALVLAVAVGAYALGSGGDGSETVTAAGQAPPGASAVVERTGDQGILRVTGLPQRRNGIYEVWIARAGQVQPSTLFQVHRDGTGAAAIPEGLEDADQVMVTLEPPGGSAKPTRAPLIVTKL